MEQFAKLNKNIVRNILYRLSKENFYSCNIALSTQPNFITAIDNDLFFRRKFLYSIDINIWKHYFPQYPVLKNSFKSNDQIYQNCIQADDILFHDIAVLWRFYQGDHEFMECLCRNLLDYVPVELSMGEFERFLYEINSLDIADRFADNEMNFRLLSTIELLDGLIERHNFNAYWTIIPDYLARWNPLKNDISAFIRKYKLQLDWSNRGLYQFIEEKFIEENVQLHTTFDWNTIVTKVKLSEGLLAHLMTAANARISFNNTWINASYIAYRQELSESFIDKWFVDTCSDNSTNWNNIFKHQTLSDEFTNNHKNRKI